MKRLPIPEVPPDVYLPVCTLTRSAHYLARLIVKLAQGDPLGSVLKQPRQRAALEAATRTIYHWNRHLRQSRSRRPR
jgi:hypothetical protein